MSFFDFVAPFYDRMHRGRKKTFQKIEELAAFSLADTVGDIGGGTGRIGELIAPHVHEVHVVDPSVEMIKECRKKSGLRCALAGAEQLPFADGYFSKIVIVDAFHHFKDQAQAVDEMKRVLKVGGLIIIEEFHPGRTGGRIAVLFEKLLRLGSTFHTPERLAKIFLGNGFSVAIQESGGKEYYLLAKKLS